MTLVITRGLPGSGKTTERNRWLDMNDIWLSEREALPPRFAVSRDDLRRSMFQWDGNHPVVAPGDTRPRGALSQEQEGEITKALDSLVRSHLAAGYYVLVDNQHLRDRDCRQWRDVARELGHFFEVIDLRGVPLEVCLTRNASRPRPVPEQYIRSQHERFIQGRDLTAPLADSHVAREHVIQQYVPNPTLPDAYGFDLDGTLADNSHRSPYDEEKAGADKVHQGVADLARMIHRQRYLLDGPLDAPRRARVLILTARRADKLGPTITWLWENDIPFDEIFCRPAGDSRPDPVIKLEILHNQVAPKYNLLGVFDDRDRVVQAYRRAGVRVYQVAPGAF